ncbi:MAG: RusA family crossover junction endodeoxyribonuclease [Candidatus Marinimicrobia bacterium]|nr:RusA family crossover junction endodeoxyribonuclease [Candidatus Neomarinimicrobiota bacterium]
MLIDGGLKFILDALTGIVWQDDEQVIEVHLYKNIGSQENKTSIIVKEL